MAADAVEVLQWGGGVEGALFRKVAEQGHYAGRTVPTRTRQGIYAAAPSGALLASINTTHPAAMRAMLEQALERWEALPRAERLLPTPPPARPSDRSRFEDNYPQTGLVLQVTSRDLPRAGHDTRRWNQDHAWFRWSEARAFLPETIEPGQTHQVPAPLVRRLARCHFLDNVNGQTPPFLDATVQEAHLTVEVTSVQGNQAKLRLTGATRTHQQGTWPVQGHADASTPTPQTRGVALQLLGHASYDLATTRFVAFELIAAGTRQGGTQYNSRTNDLAPAPIAFVLALPPEDAPPVAPAHFLHYGWPRRTWR